MEGIRRTRAVGLLCIVAVLVLSGILVSSAFAEPPEFKVCIKAQKNAATKRYTGSYKDKGCSEPEPKGEGEYERAEWSKAKKDGFTGKNPKGVEAEMLIMNPYGARASELEPPDASPPEPRKPSERATRAVGLACKTEKVVGKITGPKTERFRVEYSDCELYDFYNETPFPQEQRCATEEADAKKRLITTEELEGTLVFLNSKGEAHPKVGLRIKSLGAEGIIAHYECLTGSDQGRIEGELIAEPEGNINTASKDMTLSSKAGALRLQNQMYEEGAYSEENGKEYFEWRSESRACVEREMKEGLTKEVAEEACSSALGAPKAPPPISLFSEYTEEAHSKTGVIHQGVGLQITTTAVKGEAFLIET